MSRPPAESRVPTTSTVVDAEVLAHGQLGWEGEFNGTRFTRLQDVALSDTPRVAVKLAFVMLDRRPVVHGTLSTEVELVCQRCMGAMRYPLHERFELMLIGSNSELDQVPEPYEPWQSNVQRLNVFDLIEEQLLLALPLIAKHEDEAECVRVAPGLLSNEPADEAVERQQEEVPQNDAVQRPFGNLRDLLRK